MDAFRGVAYSAVAATYLLIVLGGVVRASGSGLGCPDWPLCYGQLVPPAQPPAVLEYTHRVLAAVSSILTLGTVALWARAHGYDWRVLAAGGVTIGLVAAQIALGALTVALELPPMVVLAHLGLGMLLLGVLVAIAVGSHGPGARGRGPGVGGQGSGIGGQALEVSAGAPEPRRPTPSPQPLAAGAVVAVFLLVLTGAYVRASGASWACAGFPACNGELLPLGSGRLVDIHLLHRLAAYLVAAHLLVTIARAWRSGVWPAACLVGGCLVAQMGIGAAMVSIGVPAIAQVLHVAGAAALWGSTVALFVGVRESGARGHTPGVRG